MSADHPSGGGDAAWSPDSRTIAVVEEGIDTATVRLIDAATGKSIRSFENTLETWGLFKTLAWSSDGKTIAIGSYNTGSLCFYDAATGKRTRYVPSGLKRNITAGVSWSADGKRLRTTYFNAVNNGFGQTWVTASGQLLSLDSGQAFHSPDQKVWGVLDVSGQVGFARSGGQVVSISNPWSYFWHYEAKLLVTVDKQRIQFWDTSTGQNTSTITAPQNLTAISLCSDRKTLATGHRETRAVLFLDAKTGKLRREVKLLSGVYWLAYSPDGKYPAVERVGARTIELRTPDGERIVYTLPTQAGNNLAWAPDGKTLATGRDLPQLWDAASGKHLSTLVPLSDNRGLAVSADGHYKGTPLNIDRELRYVIETDKGQETLTVEEFSKRFDWKNDPSKVRLTAP